MHLGLAGVLCKEEWEMAKRFRLLLGEELTE